MCAILAGGSGGTWRRGWARAGFGKSSPWREGSSTSCPLLLVLSDRSPSLPCGEGNEERSDEQEGRERSEEVICKYYSSSWSKATASNICKIFLPHFARSPPSVLYYISSCRFPPRPRLSPETEPPKEPNREFRYWKGWVEESRAL